MIATLSPEAGAHSASVMIEHLPPVLASGAARTVLAPDDTGKVRVPPSRRPTLFAMLRQDLGPKPLEVALNLAGGFSRRLRYP